MPDPRNPGVAKDIPMTKAIISTALAVLALAGCAGMPSGGQNLNGFPVDEKCMSFYGDDPFYKGNRALAYATNCTGTNTSLR